MLCSIFLAMTAITARAATTISGTVVGYDGKALPKANVQILRQGQTKPIATVEADPDGAFTVETEATGLLVLRFSGVGHQSSQVPVLISGDRQMELTAQLKPYRFDTAYDSVRVVGDFNKFSLNDARPLTLQEDGTYTAEFDVAGDRFSYQLINLADGVFGVNGTSADDYTYDPTGTYRSVVNVKDGKATVVFDPSALPRPKKLAAEIHFTDTLDQQLWEVFDGMARRSTDYQEALAAHCRAGKSISTFDYNWAPEITKLTRQIARTKDSTVRQALLIAYLDLGTHDAKRDLNKTLVTKALDEIPPSSPLWAVNPRLVTLAVSMADTGEKYRAYMEAVINQHPDPTVQAPLVYDELMAAQNTNDKDLADKYYERLVTEFVDTPYASMARYAVMR